MAICPCSPDVGDCPRCKKNWIRKVVENMKEGSFTKQASAHHMTTQKFSKEVLKNPKRYALKTRRRAQFLKNISRKNSRRI